MRLIQYLAIFSIWMMSHSNGICQYIPNEYILYLSNNTTSSEVSNIANTWHSDVISSTSPGTNIAVLRFTGSFPFKNPFNTREQIHDIIEIVGHIVKHEPEGDGGALNQYVGQPIPGLFGNNCYDQSMLENEVGEESVVTVGVFDSGTNWELANQNGFDFGAPHEVNGDASDNNGHGTHVSSIVNGVYLNSNGGSNTEDVHYLFGNPLSNNGSGTLADVVLSMQEAIIHGVNVINCSFSYLAPTMRHSGQQGTPMGGTQETAGYLGLIQMQEDPLYLLMASADPTSTLFVVSAGNNDGRNLDEPTPLNVYPAAFPIENMVTVASYNCSEEISEFSNFGPESVELTAPGENIVSIDHEMSLVSYSGTSQSAAYVSGAASVLGTYLPVFNAAKVKCAIVNGAKKTPLLQGKVNTGGMLDLPMSIEYILSNECGSLNRLGTSPANNVSISPTIVSEEINVIFNLDAPSPVEISIISIDGKLLRAISKKAVIGNNEIAININNLSIRHGFLVRIRTNEFSKTTKHFIIQ